MRKFVGSVILLAWMLGYIAVATLIGDRVTELHWGWQMLYFPIAGIAWVLPVKPLLKWIHANDPPQQDPNVQ